MDQPASPESLLAGWPVDRAAAGVTDATGTRLAIGDDGWRVGIASVSKLVTGYTTLVAIDAGTLELDEAAGPAGATVADLLAHASGLAFDSAAVLAPPRTRRIYSNTGIEQLAEYVARRAGTSFSELMNRTVFEPLGMAETELRGSAAHNVVSTVTDLLVFARELLAPRLVEAGTFTLATTPRLPELRGMLPGVGRMDPNTWGLAFEIKGKKQPHWTGTRNSPATFGHFGGTGTFLWIDPEAGLGCVALTDRRFGPWALEAWPTFSDAVLAACSPRTLLG